MEGSPLVTVNILSFNRKDELRNTLTKVYEQDYKNIEVIVVDNASSDGSPEMVEKEFPKVKLLKLEKNIGIAGWNEGFKAAKGEFILVLDDDSYPLKTTIYKALIAFNNNKVGIVALRIYNALYNKFDTDNIKKRPIYFLGCGAVIKKTLIDRIGGYNSDLFLYHNEIDFTIRCKEFGYQMIYNENSIVVHNFNKLGRGSLEPKLFVSEKMYYYSTLSYSIYIIQHYRLLYLILYLIKWLVNRTIVAIFYNYWGGYFKAFGCFIFNIYGYVKHRNVMSSKIQKEYLNLFAFVDRDFFPKFVKPNLFKCRNSEK